MLGASINAMAVSVIPSGSYLHFLLFALILLWRGTFMLVLTSFAIYLRFPSDFPLDMGLSFFARLNSPAYDSSTQTQPRSNIVGLLMLEVHDVTKSPFIVLGQSMGSDVVQRWGEVDNAQVLFVLLPLHPPLQSFASAPIQILISQYYVSCNVLKAKPNVDWFALFYSLLDMI